MSSSKNFSLHQLAEILQTKLQEKAREDKVLKLSAQQDIDVTYKPNHHKNSGDKEDSSYLSAISENAWQESSNKAMLRHWLGIGPELDLKTQNTLSQTICTIITHTCGLTLKETYTTYQNEGMWDNVIKRMLIICTLFSFIVLANILLEVLAYPIAVKTEWS